MFEGIDASIGSLLEKFVEKPECLSHLLFVGPPGSGKTTTAHNLVKAFYKERKTFTGKALFLNSSDERSLDAVRSKVYPFARSQIHVLFGTEFFMKKMPKIMVIFSRHIFLVKNQLYLLVIPKQFKNFLQLL